MIKSKHGGGKGSQYTSAKVTSGSPVGQNVKHVPTKGGGKSSISELPGQYTGAPKSGGK